MQQPAPLKIVVAGPSGSGKTAVAMRLITLLQKEGFIMELKDAPDEPLPDHHEMNMRLNHMVNRNAKITVETAIIVPRLPRLLKE